MGQEYLKMLYLYFFRSKLSSKMMKGWKKITIILVVGVIIAVFGLTTGILWSLIYTSILESVSITVTFFQISN